MATYLDMMHYPVDIVSSPQRIVSLVPSLTLLLHDLGLADRVVGVTKFCVHPQNWRKDKVVIGGTKMLHHETIESLEPDLILANKEENNQSDIEQLQEKFPVWVSDISNLADAYEAIRAIGAMTEKQDAARKLLESIEQDRATFSKPKNRPRVAYVIWNEPLMLAGGDTFIDSMLDEGGWHNAAKDFARYPAFTLEGLKSIAPDLIFLSSEPFPFKEQHKKQFESIVSIEHIHLIDGEPFSWYGSKLKDSFAYFAQLHQLNFNRIE